jgi:ATP-binding cassette subfamily B protein
VAWVSVFLNKQKVLDYKRFEASSRNQSAIIQMINGMHEIKLSASELQKRWEWEKLQARLFRFNIKSLSLRQIQQAGSYILNEGKNILITFLSAKYVIEGKLSLGEMLAIQYLIGQLNVPIEHLVQFVKSTQDASISLKRLNEVHEQPDEEPEGNYLQSNIDFDKNIIIDNLRFTYPGAGNHAVLNNINIDIPAGKVTAIVGMSGSGKTTLLKLLLKFHTPDSGSIKLGNYDLNNISHMALRTRCGVVMQDGFIFSDTIAANIALGYERVDLKRMEEAIRIANLEDLIAQLPLGINTKIGSEGNGISQGQKQRILIARAIYKDPGIILFDEATNALDAKNEKVIMENLDEFFKHRTVIVVAHRLSTVKNADQIIVIDKGMVAETGNHETLTRLKGHYYHLVKNQLELGN